MQAMQTDGYIDWLIPALTRSGQADQPSTPTTAQNFTPAAPYGPESCTKPTCCSTPVDYKLHIVMVPYPVQGQINPMMQFAKLLTASRDDILVTFVTNKLSYDRICRTPSLIDSPTHSSLRLTWVASGPLPANFNPNNLADMRHLRESTSLMKEPLKQLLQSLNYENPLVSCVLFGTLFPWAQSAASELGIPNFLFWTQSAAVFSIYYHLPLLVANNFFPYGNNSLSDLSPRCSDEDLNVKPVSELVTCIPGLPALHPSSFPSSLHVDDISNPSLATIREQFSLMGSCSGILINSFQELEKDTLQALQQELPYPVLLVGPLLPSAFFGVSNSADKTTGVTHLMQDEKSDCIKWLDGRQKQSVLYISFGSLFKPSSAELEAIALGIKASKQPYLWVIRPSSQDFSETLPKGFVEETRDYGLIIPWAPQVQVLNHPAVGAFLSHCGWNSTLESLSMGMPMISYPIVLDQITNGACICDIWKVGMALKRQEDGNVKCEDVEKVIRTVLQEDEGSRVRERAMKLRGAARQALLSKQDGSSHAHIENFMQAITRNNSAIKCSSSNIACT